jgi:hypothetical protein
VTDPDNQPDVAEQPLAHDLRCACGYNLRGLRPLGRCPECGAAVIVSLVASADSGDDARAPVETAWARQMVTAIILAMTAEAARTGMALVPLSVFGFGTGRGGRGDSVGMDLYFSLVSVWWVIQWYAALKLTRLTHQERSGPSSARLVSEQAVAWGLRATATLFMVMPGAMMLLDDERLRGGPTTSHLVARAAAMLVAALFFLRVRDVCRRVGAAGPGAQAELLAWLLPFSMWSSRTWTSWRAGPYALASVVGLPSYQFGDTLWLPQFVRSFPRDVGSAMSAAPAMAVAAGCWVVMIKALIALRRAGRPPAARGGRSATSSAP